MTPLMAESESPPRNKRFSSKVDDALASPVATGQAGPSTGTHKRAISPRLYLVRYEETPRFLWADAIRVNQHGLKERSLWVKRTADIYRLADRVVVWLGPEKNDSGGSIRIPW